MITRKKPQYIYRKLFKNYTIVILGIIVFLEMYFIVSIRNQVSLSNINYNQIACEDVGNFIKKISDTSDLIQYKLYQSDVELSDVILYLDNSIGVYLQKKLDVFADFDSSDYRGIDDFAMESFRLNNKLKKVSFLSFEQKRVISFGVGGETSTYSYDENFLDALKEGIIVDKDGLTFVKDIRNPISMKSYGYLLITFDVESLKKSYESNGKSELIVFYKDGHLIFDSKGNEDVTYLLNENGVLLNQRHLEKQLNSYVSYYAINDIHIIRYIPKNIADKIPTIIWISLFAIGIILFFIGEILVRLRLEHLTKRLERLLLGMERVRGGDIDTYVEIENENDEYNIIAEYFNQMCVDLNTHIQKSYLAEIEQKNAELEALQSQINPHFLYNTLEAIRMKAICNGDREVGKMLYGLAIIFRSQIKESDVITIAKELYYCKKYLELFEFRYQNKFTFEINCLEEYMENSIIKFVLQPIVENYFVHGIRLKDSDNFIRITVNDDNGIMIIVVEDNGNGIAEDELVNMNKKLKENKVSKGSIGVSNVQRRIAAAYGNEFGVHLEKNNPMGLRVILRFPREVK